MQLKWGGRFRSTMCSSINSSKKKFYTYFSSAGFSLTSTILVDFKHVLRELLATYPVHLKALRNSELIPQMKAQPFVKDVNWETPARQKTWFRMIGLKGKQNQVIHFKESMRKQCTLRAKILVYMVKEKKDFLEFVCYIRGFCGI